MQNCISEPGETAANQQRYGQKKLKKHKFEKKQLDKVVKNPCQETSLASKELQTKYG